MYFVNCRMRAIFMKKMWYNFYCENDKKFLPDRYVKGTCPYCKADDQYSDLCEKCGRVPEEILDPKCSICSSPPVKKSSLHYFFRLGSFADKLESWLESNKNLQSDVKKYVQNWIKSGTGRLGYNAGYSMGRAGSRLI